MELTERQHEVLDLIVLAKKAGIDTSEAVLFCIKSGYSAIECATAISYHNKQEGE